MKKFLKFFLILFLVLSCNNNPKIKQHAYTLYFDAIDSTIDKPFFKDSINITYYALDSIIIKNYYKGYFYENRYFNYGDKFYEKRYVFNPITNYSGIDTILSLSTKDTTFIYRAKRDDFIVNLIDISLFDSKYNIVKEGDNYKSIKQSLIDTTYKEIIYYDKNYRIYKYVNTWKGDKCTYLENNLDDPFQL